MNKYNIAILTDERFENPSTIDDYTANILLEEELLQKGLTKRGLTSIRVDWARKDFDWSSVDYAIFRTTWNYMHRIEAFNNWLEETNSKTHFMNSYASIQWNKDKHYFKDLMAKGINIPPTIYALKGDNITLQEFFDQAGYKETVIKPTISGGAKFTYRINQNNIAEYADHFEEILQTEDMMIQPFLENVMTRGEVSMMVMGGKFTHAILKVAKAGDFRVQDDWGGTVHNYTPTQAEMDFAEAVVKACPYETLYARIDIANDNDGNITLIELEIFEPELWFRFHPPAADELAEAISQYVKG